MRSHLVTRSFLVLFLLVGIGVGIGPRNFVAAQPPQPAPVTDADLEEGDGIQLLTRGPVHEAFAEPLIFDPKPAPVVPKEPPPPVEEVPPDQKPEGDNVVWISGYWSWDDQRNDFIWISGLWRNTPPGRRWIPGYWSQVDGGSRWTQGFWGPLDQGQLRYLPAPPASLEVGASGPPPSPDSIWTPGTWVWQDNRYVWQPGTWVDFQPEWVWNPPEYFSTPSGYVYNDGYWDRPLLDRGQAFAPVYYQQPVYRQPGYHFTPSLALVASALASSLFVRPASQQYYFGDYYDANNFQSGIYPWYSFHQSRYGYDPIFAHDSRLQARRNPNWLNELHEDYRYRREHPEARPPQTYAQQRAWLDGGNRNNNTARAQNLILTRPFRQVAASPDSRIRYEKIDEPRRREFAERTSQLRQFGQQRRDHEIAATGGQQTPRPGDGQASRHFNLPKAAVAARDRGTNPPPRPKGPGLDLESRPIPQNQVTQRRFEPHPDRLPREVLRPNFEAAGQPNNREAGRPGSGTPKAERRPDVPKAERPPDAPKKAERRPDVPKAERGPDAPKAERGPDAPKAERRPDVPKKAESRPDVPKAERRPEQPKKDEPKAERHPEQPKKEAPAAKKAGRGD